jgi:PEP-CTERM motif
MRVHLAWLTLLCLALAAIPSTAQYDSFSGQYDNGPINGTTDAWTINFGYVVSDTFTGLGDYAFQFSFGVWELPGDTMSSVQWSITSGENSGTVYASGSASGSNLTDSFISSNQYGYNIDTITVTGINVYTSSATTYWLNLQNAAVPSGDPVYWDENSGAGCGGLNGTKQGCPSMASESAVGTIPSEAFTFGISRQGTPEPNSIMLLGSGILGLAGMLRRKLF